MYIYIYIYIYIHIARSRTPMGASDGCDDDYDGHDDGDNGSQFTSHVSRQRAE